LISTVATEGHHNQIIVAAAAVTAVTVVTVVIVIIDVVVFLSIVVHALFLLLFRSCHFGRMSFPPFRSPILKPNLQRTSRTGKVENPLNFPNALHTCSLQAFEQ
jgi:hypothetical protein